LFILMLFCLSVELADTCFDAHPHLLAGRVNTINYVIAVLRVEVLAVGCSAVEVLQFLNLFAVNIIVNFFGSVFIGIQIFFELVDGFGCA